MIGQIKNFFSKPDSDKTYYQLIGEEMGTYELVKTFYEKMETDPKAQDCLNVHALTPDKKIPDEVKKKLFMFLCGWMGGPNLFVETFGPPKMRARHLGFPIGIKEAEQWLLCMNFALNNHSAKLHKTVKTQMNNSFKALASRIVNQN